MSTESMICADAVQWAKEYEGSPFHAALLDPPYELNFMNSKWDSTGVAFRVETWEAFKRVLYPGAFLMAFAGTRGYHRMACAIEDAGFIIHPAIGWAFGSGFCKATRIDTQIDRAAGAEQIKVGIGLHAANRQSRPYGQGAKQDVSKDDRAIKEPATDLAKIWQGHRYGGQALKPAFEFICVAQVPYKGRPVDNIVETGAGSLNIDLSRIGTSSRTVTRGNGSAEDIFGNGGERVRKQEYAGRWPSNLILGDFEVAAMLDRQSGQTRSNASARNNQVPTGQNGIYSHFDATVSHGHDDSGGASRFFFQVQTQLDEADPLYYAAKAGRAERDAGLEGMPMVSRQGARPNSPDATGKFPEHDHREIGRNCHPCLKPLSLTRYLASLLLPPAEYAPRRLFNPFAGTASECIGAELAGWEEVNAVEMAAEYCRIGDARRRFWACNSGLFDQLTQADEADEPQGDLFAAQEEEPA